MKKKILSIILAGAVVCSMAGCGGEKKHKDTKDGIGDSLVLYSSMTENDIDNLVEAFNNKYPDCEVEVVTGSAGELTARIQAETENPQGDVMWGGLGDSEGDAYKDIFAHWLSDYEDEVMDGYKSTNGFYNFDHLSTVAFCVNTELEKDLGIEIKGYKDLLNPKLKGKIVFSDPNSSSAAWNNMCNIMAVYGNDTDESWDYIEKLVNNGLIISTSSSVCFKSVETGEYVVGLTYEDGASTLLKSGADNVRIVYPEEGTSAAALGCAVVKGAPHEKAAKAMVNFLMSAEGQDELGEALGTLRMTNKNDTYKPKYLMATDEVPWVKRDTTYMTEHKEEILKHWNDLYTKANK